MEKQKVIDSDNRAWQAGSSVLEQLPFQNGFYQNTAKWDSPLHRQCRCTQAENMLLGSAVNTAFSAFYETQYMQEAEAITPLASSAALAKPTEVNKERGGARDLHHLPYPTDFNLHWRAELAKRQFTITMQPESMGISVFFGFLLLFNPKILFGDLPDCLWPRFHWQVQTWDRKETKIWGARM